MSTQTVAALIGEELTSQDPYGQDMSGDLIDGYTNDRSIVHIPPMQIGDGLAGPLNDQQLQIFRDNRPIATDELGMQGPFHWGGIARHRAGRRFPLNYEFDDALDYTNPGLPIEQDVLVPSPLSPGELEVMHDGVPPVEVLGSARTVYYTATPQVGWQGY